ncbi:hypothetical protein B0T25DRAFT_451417 [Lasiosphaeria hispida]|uniref:Uncharacterized protein n=1 Tax=Lasiosphaeria hispida TaxID=260671 RepID=A0AAJ0MGR7_9PEZI|nr:hypothetical protein B0T25DRAFT_451417 [Lasiosphaeria hispida]
MSDFWRSKRARYRYTEHSSSDSGEGGTFLVSNVKFRVGAPPPQPLPAQSGWSIACTKVQEALGTSLQVQAEIIAEAEGVEPLSVEFLSRFAPGSDNHRPTILIVAKWSKASPPIWEKIVKEAKKFADSSTRGASLQDVEVCVEMVAEELTLTKYVAPIPDGEVTKDLSEDWPRIADKVVDILDAYPATQSRVTSLALFKLGFSEDFDKNRRTVYISVDYESEESKWPPVVGEIQQLLNRYPHDLHVHMEHNTSESYPEFEVVEKFMTERQRWEKDLSGFNPSRKYNKLVGLGDDIGPQRYLKLEDSSDELYFPGVGTLGCWIELKSILEPHWTRYALTNYHVVRPAFDGFQIGKTKKGEIVPVGPVKDSVLWKVDMNGIGPKFSLGGKVDIEHPTRVKHCYAVQILSERITKSPNNPNAAKTKTHLEDIKSFFDKNEQHLGSIYCASGYTRRSNNNGRMDWALIRPTGSGIARIGKNTLPAIEVWDNNGYAGVAPNTTEALGQPPSNGLRSLKNGDHLFKLGTTTGATAGSFSQLKPMVRLAKDRHVQAFLKARDRPYLSDEFQFFGHTSKNWVAKEGDSGSVVFDDEGRAVGLLFGGQMVQNAACSYAYVTPIEDVFADIRLFSNGQITEIRIAEDS